MKYSCSVTVTLSRPTSEAAEFLSVGPIGMGSCPRYVPQRCVDWSWKIKLKTNQTFEHGVMQNIFLSYCLDSKLTKVVNKKLKSLGKAKSRISEHPKVAQKFKITSQTQFDMKIDFWIALMTRLNLPDSKNLNRTECVVSDSKPNWIGSNRTEWTGPIGLNRTQQNLIWMNCQCLVAISYVWNFWNLTTNFD